MITLPEYVNNMILPKLPADKQAALFNALVLCKHYGLNKGANKIVLHLVKHNTRLVLMVLHKYRKNGFTDMPWEDMFQEGLIGLYEGIRGFDISRKYKLSTYVVPIIWQHMEHMLNKENKFTQYKRSNPITELLEKKLAAPEPEVEEDRSEDIARLHKAMRRLRPKQRETIVKYFGLNGKKPMIDREISESWGKSRRLSQHYRISAINDLRKMMGVK